MFYVLYPGSKKMNTRKRPICNGEFLEPVEDPMNGNLKRFAGIGGNLYFITTIFTL